MPCRPGTRRSALLFAVISSEMLIAQHAAVRGDNEWQQRARLLQSQWRQRQGLAVGTHRGNPLGSRITLDDGQPPTLANYLAPQAKKQVQTAVEQSRTSGALLSRPRLWVDLLSSQPLCFNLFGPLAEDLDLATAALRLVWPNIHQVTAVQFEWSPGRGDHRYTGNRSAFDVFITYLGPNGRGFLGIEVKYHEDLSGTPARDNDGRYPAIARRHGIFREDALPELQRLPLQQTLARPPPRPADAGLGRRRMAGRHLRPALPDRQHAVHRSGTALPAMPHRHQHLRRPQTR